MSLVKVKQKYQVTIPATIREQVELGVGDMLEAPAYYIIILHLDCI